MGTNENGSTIDFVAQAINDVIAPIGEEPERGDTLVYTPPRPIVQTLAFLQQHADGTLGDILATLRRAVEQTIQQLEDEKDARERWLRSYENALNRIQPQRDALVHELIAERERKDIMRKNWSESLSRSQESCDTLAAVNAKVVNERNAMMAQFGIPESSTQDFILDHIDYLNNACESNGRMQDIATEYRGALKKIVDVLTHDDVKDKAKAETVLRIAGEALVHARPEVPE